MKNVVKVLLGLALMVYIGFVIVKWSKEDTEVCNYVEVVVDNSTPGAFITSDEIKAFLNENKLDLRGKSMKDVNLLQIDTLLKRHPFIAHAVCFKTPGGIVRINVEPRNVVMRIMSEDGKNYFIDSNGDEVKMCKVSLDVVVSTGRITAQYAKEHLARIGTFLSTDKFWNSQIVQLNVKKDGTVEMFPRLGNHVVNLGNPIDFNQNLARLKEFYLNVLNKVGWNKYEYIDLQYNNQIVCRKAE